MQKRVWNAYIVTPNQGKHESRLNRFRQTCETHALWHHTKENAKTVLTDADTRVKRITLLRHTIEIAKAVLTDAETHLKRMHSDAIPIETQKPFKRRRHAYETHAL